MNEELFDELEQFRNEREWKQFHSPANLAKSISIEAAELLECFQWDDDYNLEQVKEELADVFTYCLFLSADLELDPDQIVREKLSKTREKYPVNKARGRSTKYTDL